MEELKITITPNAEGKTEGVITILQGTTAEPLPLHEKKATHLKGIITNPGDYNDKRNATFQALEAHVIADYKNRKIKLVINEADHLSCSVEGELLLNPELEKLKINTENSNYTEKELMQRLNFFRAYFNDVTEHTALMESLKQFNAKVDKEIINANNLQGTAVLKYAYDIKHSIPLNFTLNMPIFADGAKFIFGVEINLSYIDGNIKFWLQSVGLYEAIIEQTEKIFATELGRLQDYAIIKQY